MRNFETLVTLALTEGLDLKTSQDLVIRAPLEARTLCGQIGKQAYLRKARSVTCLYDDPYLLRDRIDYGSDEAVDFTNEFTYKALKNSCENGAVLLDLLGPYPDLLNEVPLDRIVRAHSSMNTTQKAMHETIALNQTRHAAIPFVTKSWGRKVFPTESIQQATKKLWEIVFTATRITNANDPLFQWSEYRRCQKRKLDNLNSANYQRIHIYDRVTDLTLGLSEKNAWYTNQSKNAFRQFPDEAIFTNPNCEQTEGTLALSRPLTLAGREVSGITLKFKSGALANISATKNHQVLESLLSIGTQLPTIEKMALVPNSAPLSKYNIPFYYALFDSNACSHVTLASNNNRKETTESNKYRANEPKINTIRIDCMFGNADMNIDGITTQGKFEPIMRFGEFIN